MTPSVCGGNELCEAAVVVQASRLWGQRAPCPLTRDVVIVEGDLCEPVSIVIGVAELRPPEYFVPVGAISPNPTRSKTSRSILVALRCSHLRALQRLES